VFRYVAFVWDDADFAARESAGVLCGRLRASSAEWGAVLDRKGLRVFCADVRAGSSEPYCLHDNAGVVLGKLFQSGSKRASTTVTLRRRARRWHCPTTSR
jgi:hypothetical protein